MLCSVRYLDDERTEAVVDWEDPAAARALTTTLLRHDFSLAWDIPLERLCPPVPNRLNYICWVRDLLLLGHPELDDAAGASIESDDLMLGGMMRRFTPDPISLQINGRQCAAWTWARAPRPSTPCLGRGSTAGPSSAPTSTSAWLWTCMPIRVCTL